MNHIGAHYERRHRGLPLTRRQYNVTMPMALWHIDCEFNLHFLIYLFNLFSLFIMSCFLSNVEFTILIYFLCIATYDKLAMYGLRIHGCIDGASHYVLYAKVATDKTQETIFEPFRVAMQKFGTPLRVRLDFAAEHVLIREFMEEARVDTRNPFLVASSVHNQVSIVFLNAFLVAIFILFLVSFFLDFVLFLWGNYISVNELWEKVLWYFGTLGESTLVLQECIQRNGYSRFLYSG